MYSLELFNTQSGQIFLADITYVAENISFEIKLNDISTIDFSLPIYKWQEFCDNVGIDPYTSLKPKTVSVKLKRDRTYLPVVFEIRYSSKTFDLNPTIEVSGACTLSKLGDRIITKNYLNVDSCDIARDLITVTQAKTYGNFGISFGNLFQTGVLSQRTYERYNIKDAIKNLSDDESGGFDFYFGHDQKFYTFPQGDYGSLKNDIVYKFPSENVVSLSNPEDASNLYNSVTTVGYGIGDPIESTQIDAVSAQEYGLRENALIYSEIQNPTWLESKAKSELAKRKNIFNLPSLVTTGECFNLSYKWVGDTIPFQCSDKSSPYIGNGRIQKLSVALDEGQNESITIELVR